MTSWFIGQCSATEPRQWGQDLISLWTGLPCLLGGGLQGRGLCWKQEHRRPPGRLAGSLWLPCFPIRMLSAPGSGQERGRE